MNAKEAFRKGFKKEAGLDGASVVEPRTGVLHNPKSINVSIDQKDDSSVLHNTLETVGPIALGGLGALGGFHAAGRLGGAGTSPADALLQGAGASAGFIAGESLPDMLGIE